ncbi:MAG TPA: hypothetical protein DCP28_02295, partial [Cytophagales bacterium]|nr:hypothetical protein [Cytophagales bacterium]
PVQDFEDIAALPANAIREQITYTDGLGRGVQTIFRRANPQGQDMVNFTEYDALGRSTRQNLPYVATTPDGNYQQNPAVDQAAFYLSAGDKVANDAYPFAEIAVDGSPLGRVLEIGAPGADWQLGQHTVKQDVRLNTTNEVIQWSASGTFLRYYPANALVVQLHTDENGHQVESFLDARGRSVFKRVEISPNNWAKTYQVYDAFDRVAFIIQPEGVEVVEAATLSAGWDITQQGLGGYLFSYVYDNRGRLVEKSSPGTGPTFLVYDQQGRLVLAQDPNLRALNQWSYVKYDAKQRFIVQGYYTDNTRLTRAAMQSYVSGLNGTFTATEIRQAGTAHGYSNTAFPTQNITVSLVNYYDDYDFDGNGTADYVYQNANLGIEEPVPYTYTRNWPTGTKMRVLDTNDWVTSASLYDDDLQVVQIQSNNTLNTAAQDVETRVYDFEGKLVKTETQLQASGTETVVNRWEFYDNGAPLRVYQQNNGDAEQLVAEYTYNALNQLVEKDLHQESAGFLQSVDYRYNIRGWLTHINNETLTNDGVTNDDGNDLFGMEFHYADAVSGLNNTATFNGNLSALSWQINDANHVNTIQRPRAYAFQYDGMGRLTSADYAAQQNGQWTAELGGYSVSNITYDKNGNLLTLQRRQLNLSQQTEVIDNLTYSYATHSNQLQQVEDAASLAAGFLNGSTTAQEYTWSDAGDLTADANKGITSITYNQLGKTKQVLFADGKSIAFWYLADGTRVKKVSDDGTNSTTTDYLDGFVYENQSLVYQAMPEGRVRVSGTQRVYEYFLTDHQGNTRVSFESDLGTAKVVQENHYYPFGLTMEGYIQNTPMPSEANQNLYNAGAELQDDFGGAYGNYSTFYREYDPALGRFNAVDPKADWMNALTPYQYANNDPINFNDPLGDHFRRVSILNIFHARNKFGRSCEHCDPGGNFTTPMLTAAWSDPVHNLSFREPQSAKQLLRRINEAWKKGDLSNLQQGFYKNQGNGTFTLYGQGLVKHKTKGFYGAPASWHPLGVEYFPIIEFSLNEAKLKLKKSNKLKSFFLEPYKYGKRYKEPKREKPKGQPLIEETGDSPRIPIADLPGPYENMAFTEQFLNNEGANRHSRGRSQYDLLSVQGFIQNPPTAINKIAILNNAATLSRMSGASLGLPWAITPADFNSFISQNTRE